jgi:hypothetical protein
MKYKLVVTLLLVIQFNCSINHKLIRHNSNVLKGSYWQTLNCNYSVTLNSEDTTIFHFISNYEVLILNNNRDTIFGYYKAKSVNFISYIYFPNMVKLDKYFAELPNRLVNEGQLRFAKRNFQTFQSLYKDYGSSCYSSLITNINLTYNNDTVNLMGKYLTKSFCF